MLWLTGLLASSFGVEAPALGVEPFPFGSGVVTSVGMRGLDEACFVDGFQGAAPAREFRRVFADPWSLDRYRRPPDGAVGPVRRGTTSAATGPPPPGP